MRIALQDIEEATRELTFDESTDELNALFERGAVHDYRFSLPATVHMRCHRSGVEVFCAGEMACRAEGQCARCLEWFAVEVATQFSFVYVPRTSAEASEESSGGDIDLAVYDGNVVDLSPMLRERLLLSLPTLPLCSEGCRGLCPSCGANRNLTPCGCAERQGDPRLAVLRGLRLKG